MAGSVIVGGTATAVVPANLPQGPNQCREGYSWRATTAWDRVCVPLAERYLVYIDAINARGNTNRDTGACLNGYVRRDAVPGDNVCVTQASWRRAREQNKLVAYGWAGTASRDPETRIVLHPFNWSSDVYTITSGYTGRKPLVVDVYAGSTADEIKLGVWGRHGGANQEFWFRADRTRDNNVFQNKFEIVAKHSGKCLDVAWAKTQDGTRVQQYRCTGNINQKWYLWRRGDNLWEIRSLQSNKCLDVHSPSRSAPQLGAWLQLWSCHGWANQAWQVRSAGH
ncbi:RICIN domain-containing protein [Streptomyces avidinii]|uniref:RICIN domain-containing protein n=1 Tax=Streptomyces avidinii TaxID=1895 RepID=UPI00386B1FFB